MSKTDAIIGEMERLISEMTKAVENLRSGCAEDSLQQTSGSGTILAHAECIVGLGGVRSMPYYGYREDPCGICGEDILCDNEVVDDGTLVREVDRNDLPKGRTS